MTFDLQNFGRATACMSGSPTAAAPFAVDFKYANVADTLATILTAGYFDPKFPEMALGDSIMVQSSDYPNGIKCWITGVTVGATPHYTADVFPGATGKYQTIFLGAVNTASGSATQTFAATGALTTDLVTVVMPQSGTAYCLHAVVSAPNVVTAVFSADPGAVYAVNLKVERVVA